MNEQKEDALKRDLENEWRKLQDQLRKAQRKSLTQPRRNYAQIVVSLVIASAIVASVIFDILIYLRVVE